MGFLYKLRRKKVETVEKIKEHTTPEPNNSTNAPSPDRKIKSYLLKENQSRNKYNLFLLGHCFEGIAGIDVTCFQSPFEPAYPLCGAAVCE